MLAIFFKVKTQISLLLQKLTLLKRLRVNKTRFHPSIDTLQQKHLLC